MPDYTVIHSNEAAETESVVNLILCFKMYTSGFFFTLEKNQTSDIILIASEQ